MLTQPDNSNASNRLAAVRKGLGISMRAFGQPLGVSVMAVQRWEAGSAEISQVTAMAIELAYGLSHAWLLNGVSPQWVQPSRPAVSIADETFLDRPLIVGAATCGEGGSIEDPGPGASRYALRRDFAKRILTRCGGGKEEDLFFLLCRGESMCPTIQDKEIVLINTALQIRMEPKNNGIYLVRRSQHAEETRVKRLQLDKEKGELLLNSDNRTFPTVTIGLENVPLQQVILGRVVWVGRYLLDTDPPPEDW